MKKRFQPLLFTTVFIFAAATIALAAQTLWVTSESADLKAERSIASDTIAVLDRGAELSVQTFESRWYQVKTADGKTGWVYRGKVSETEPDVSDAGKKDGDGGIGGLLGGLGGSSVETNTADSARSIRGLSPEAEAYAKKTGTPKQSQEALDQVLSMSISNNDIETFLKNGKIGEYAE